MKDLHTGTKDSIQPRATLPDAAVRRRDAIIKTVQRNASGSLQLASGKFVTRQDKSLSKLAIE